MTLDAGRLRERLRDIVRPLGSSRTPAGAPARAGGTSIGDTPGEEAVRAGDSVSSVLGGEWRSSGGARSFVVTRTYAPEFAYGRESVGGFASALRTAHRGAALLATGAPRAPFVFFDLETTGLSGGAGTHAFLVGCAWFDADDALVTEQHLMVDYAGELGMLAGVSDLLKRAGALVTFNGKSFDAPVIETRYLFHRLASPCVQLPHVDVLHPARRFWGSDETGCSLTVLERQLLGAERIGDVPGFEIPARYFQFIRSGDARPLVEVFEHNRRDLLSLAGVTARLLSMLESGPGCTDDAREAIALGRVYDRNDDPARAAAAFERAAMLAVQAMLGLPRRRTGGADWVRSPAALRIEALRWLALGARRARRHDEAAARWRELLEVSGCPAHLRREANEALAIHHEHRVRDLTVAKMFAVNSLETGSEAAWGDAVRHRLARIERKMVSERALVPSLPLPPSCGSPTSGRRTSS